MEDETYDVVVIGGGGTGLMAALEAAGRGCRTLLLEKQPELGGTTALSVGSICTTNTAHQRAMGIVDTTQDHFEDMAKFAGPLESRDNLALRRVLVENVPETFKVLCEAGIQFMGPMPEPPHRRPRLHAIVPHSKGYIHHLSKALRRNGGNVLTNARAVGLMRTGNRVAGVEIERSGHKSVIHARKGVIIASGDFSSASRNYKQRFMADSLLSLSGINPASTGDGQRLGEEVGGEVVNGDLAWGPELRFLAPPKPAMISRLPPYRIVGGAVLAAMRILPNWLLRPMLMSFVTTFLAPSHNLFREGAALVNMKGKRFCDENARPQDHVSGQPEQLCYTVFDQTVADKFQAWPNFISTAPGVGYAYLGDYERSRRDIFFKADSWQELGRKMGMDGEVLSETIRDRNAGLNARTASEPPLPPLVKPPFYGLGPAKPWIVFSEGGLRVDETMRVLTPSNEAVPGLFAAGSAGQGGVILEGHGHHLGWAFTSGRIAGRSASASTTITTET